MGTPSTKTQVRATADAAADQGKEVVQNAGESTKQVTQTAKEEATHVAEEVSTQVKSLASQATEQVRGQVEQQRTKAADALRTTGDEFRTLVDQGDYSPLTTELTRRAADQARNVAQFLDNTSPAEILDQVRDFARRRPGTFLLGAALAGLITGRLIKSTATSPSPASPRTYTPPPNPAPYPAAEPAIYRSVSADFVEPAPTPVTSGLVTPGVVTPGVPTPVADPRTSGYSSTSGYGGTGAYGEERLP